jgi:hypothetical protein
VTYTFRVAAVNAAGIGAASTPSNGIVPSSSLRQPAAQGSSSVPGTRITTVQPSPAPNPPTR